MRKLAFSLVLLMTLSAQAAHTDERIGFREITLPDASRPLHVALWYPTEDAAPETIIAENPVFYGVSAVQDAKTANGAHPLVLLSHGYSGSFRNLSWLAGALARAGYVVAAPDHPGTTTFDRDPEKARRLWERPRDLSRVIDALLADPSLPIARNRIAAIGHSLGGWTVTEIAGGRFDADLVMPDCVARFGPVACKILVELGVGQSAGATDALRGDLGDGRIGAVVTLDLGPARGFTPQSLANIRIPVLVIAAGGDIDKVVAAKGEISATHEDSRYLARHLPKATSRYSEIADSLHFSFLQICKPGAIDIIEEEEPGLGIVCTDGGTRARQAIHDETIHMILAFLTKTWPAK